MKKTTIAAWLLAALATPLTAFACDDACKLAAVESYLTALTTHNASQIPFAANARRIENNRITGDTAAGLRDDLEKSSKYKIISGFSDKQVYVAGDDVFVIYTVNVGTQKTQVASGRTFERFRIINGQITQIEVVVLTSLGKVTQPTWP